MRPHLSQNIRDRLHRSLFEEQIEAARDPHMIRISGQIEEIAKSVRRATGSDWHADRASHLIFIEALKLLFESSPAPDTDVSNVTWDPKEAGRLIYRTYAETARELEQQRSLNMKATIRSKMERGDD
jgi:hypothetical protein